MSEPRYFLPYADISWQKSNTPYSPVFDDIYWSRNENPNSSLAEKQHVFINASHLSERWAQLTPGDEFTILELGFGFGLNFSLACQLWQSISNCDQSILHYVAFEQYPVSPEDLTRMSNSLDDQILDRLITAYPRPIPGPHYIWISDNICLTLILGDAVQALPTLSAEIDAIFLDGFSPDRNDQLWSGLFPTLSDLARPGATLATYSVAGQVRRDLSSSGFIINKITGYGEKAEMLQGRKVGSWLARSRPNDKTSIIGAGLSGIHTAIALSKRGIDVDLHDASDKPLGAASRLKQLAVSPQLAAVPEKTSLISLLAFEFLIRNTDYHQSGKLQLLSESRELQKAKKLTDLCPDHLLHLVSADDATRLSGITVKDPCLHFPTAGWLDPSQLITHLNRVDVNLNSSINSIEKHDSGWLIGQDNHKKTSTRNLVLATGAVPSPYLAPLQLVPARGQSLRTTGEVPSPRVILSGNVTWFPSNSQESTLSATFIREDSGEDIRNEETKLLLTLLKDMTGINIRRVESATGVRSTTRDRMPVVDKVPDWGELADYCQLNKRTRAEHFDGNQPGLYCATGFGSHGATYAPLCTEYLVRMILKEPHIPIPELAATRFAFRDAGIKSQSNQDSRQTRER